MHPDSVAEQVEVLALQCCPCHSGWLSYCLFYLQMSFGFDEDEFNKSAREPSSFDFLVPLTVTAQMTLWSSLWSMRLLTRGKDSPLNPLFQQIFTGKNLGTFG